MKKRDRRGKPAGQIKIARERIALLLDYASKTDEKMARRYFQLARKIAMRYNVKMPAGAKRNFCKYCGSRLTAGWRMKNGIMRTTCGGCGKVLRYPYRRKAAKS